VRRIPLAKPRMPFHVRMHMQEEAPWSALKPLVFAAIMDHYSSGEPLLEDKEMQARSDTAIHEDDDEVRVMVLCGEGGDEEEWS